MKRCSKCKKVKSISEFYNAGIKKYPRRLRSDCKTCVKEIKRSYESKYKARQWYKDNPEKIRNKKFKTKYKFTLEEYKILLKKQNGLCAICKKPEKESAKGKLAVDHCHKTGKIRGLLCFNCNVGIGNLRDSPILLEKALEYLNAT
jgi:Autographiviridae endonuclease VII